MVRVVPLLHHQQQRRPKLGQQLEVDLDVRRK